MIYTARLGSGLRQAAGYYLLDHTKEEKSYKNR